MAALRFSRRLAVGALGIFGTFVGAALAWALFLAVAKTMGA